MRINLKKISKKISELISKDETSESTLPNLHFLFPHIHDFWKYSGPIYKICHYKIICQTENLIMWILDTKESVLSITIMATGPNMYTEQLGPLFRFLVILI